MPETSGRAPKAGRPTTGVTGSRCSRRRILRGRRTGSGGAGVRNWAPRNSRQRGRRTQARPDDADPAGHPARRAHVSKTYRPRPAHTSAAAATRRPVAVRGRAPPRGKWHARRSPSTAPRQPPSSISCPTWASPWMWAAVQVRDGVRCHGAGGAGGNRCRWDGQRNGVQMGS